VQAKARAAKINAEKKGTPVTPDGGS
jgi:hypothetical protein